MKPQDVIFFVLLAVAIGFKSPRLSVGLGITCLLLAIPLFAKWVFFTAERLVWYAAAFFLLVIIQLLWEAKNTAQ
ncbi:MAG: hypothetical protein Q8P89_00200 [bacterium]|nr:hypothetical protein [bacterium]